MSTPTPDRCGVTTVMDGKTITCVLPPGHDDTLHQGPDGGWWLGDDSLPSVPQPSPTAGSNDGEERFEGHDSRECGEHRTTGPRAWCSNCQEWCYPGILCRGCELPLLRQRAEQAEAALQRVRNLAASLHDGVLVRCFLAALDQPEEAPTGQERAAPVDWEAIALQRERELKEAGEARHRAEVALRDLTDPRPCDPHPGNGYCQTHGEKAPCPHAAAKAILDRTEETP